MPLLDTDIHLIDQFLTGTLDKDGQDLLNERLKDEDFRTELEWKKESLAVIKQSGRAELKNKLKSFEKNLKSENPNSNQPTLQSIQSDKHPTASKTIPLKSRKKKVWPWIGVAASIALLLGVFFMQNTEEKPVDYLAIYTENYQPYPNIVAPIVKSETDSLTAYEEGFQLYEKGEYAKAIQNLTPSNSTEAEFYSAISFLALGKTEKAISSLNIITADGESRFRQPAEWYLALAYLKIEDVAKAKALLSKVMETDGHPYRGRATELMGEFR